MLETEQLVQKEYKSRQSDPLGPVRKMWVQGKGEVVETMFQRVCLKLTTTNVDGISGTIQIDHEIGARRPDLMIID